MKPKLLWTTVLLLAAAIFIWRANQQGTLVNVTMLATDQSAYMGYAQRMAETNFEFVGGRNRMPMYPAIMSFFYHDGMSDEAFFERGKKVGIAIALIGLIAVYFSFRSAILPVDAITGTLVTMFTVFVYKAPYFQTEVLYYCLSFALYVLLIHLIREPNVRVAAIAGLIGGVAHLTKASVLPAIGLAAALLLVRTAIFCWQNRTRSDNSCDQWRAMAIRLGHVAIFLSCFLMVVYPYIRTSKAEFGEYFYNVNSKLYMWHDSWAEVKQGISQHGDHLGWPDRAADELPSFRKYTQEHSTTQMFKRVADGYIELWYRVTRSYGYFDFVILYTAALLLLMIQNKSLRSGAIWQQLDPCVLLFVFGYFGGYSLLYAWYTPIAEGNRFILCLFLPAIFTLNWALAYAQKQQLNYNFFGKTIPATRLHLVVLLVLLGHVLVVLPYQISTVYGGA